MQFEFWADDNYRSSGIVDALTEQILAEAPALAFEHVAQGFEGTVAGTRDSPSVTTVIDQRVASLLQHALLVTDNDLRGLELEQVFQPVIPVDHTAIEIVEIGGSETSPFQWHQWPEIRRNNWQNSQDHPFRAALVGEEGG